MNEPMYKKELDSPIHHYFLKTIMEMGWPEQENTFTYLRDGKSIHHPIMDIDKDGNLRFFVQDINGDISTYQTKDPAKPDFKDKDVKEWYLRRFIIPQKTKDPDADPAKYMPCVAGQRMRLFFPKNLIEAYHQKTSIDTLFIVEGFKKAMVGYLNGLHIVGMNGLQGWKLPDIDEINGELLKLIQVCRPKKIVILYDSDLFEISESAKKSETSRPNQFYKATLKAKQCFSSLADVYLAHPHPQKNGDKLGLDDLLLKYRDYSLLNSRLIQPKTDLVPEAEIQNCEKQVIEDLKNGINICKTVDYFAIIKLSGLTDFQVKEYYKLNDPELFFGFHRDRLKKLKRTQFKMDRVIYDIDEDYKAYHQAENQSDYTPTVEVVGNQMIRKAFNSKGDPYRKQISNFRMNVLFQISSNNESKRIVEMVNMRNERTVIEVTSEAFTSVSKFKTSCFDNGRYHFQGNDDDLQDVRMMFCEFEKPAKEIHVMGYNDKQNVYAFANGIVNQQGFISIDKYGIVSFLDDFLYLPAFSVFNDDKIKNYESKRRFKHIPSTDTFTDLFDKWFKQMNLVYGDSGIIASLFAISAMFSDIVFDRVQGFPILCCSGRPKSGKTTICESIKTLWGNPSSSVGLGGMSTSKYFISRFSQVCNGLIHLEEYSNSLRPDVIKGIKFLYDRVGYGRKSFTNNNETLETPILSAAIMSGEEIPTVNSALFTRMFLLEFNKQQFEEHEKENMKILKDLQESGLTEITVNIVKHRDLIVSKFKEVFYNVIDQVTKTFEYLNIDERMIKNTAGIITPFVILSEAGIIHNQYTLAKLIKIFETNISKQHKMQESNTDVSKFWDVFEGLFTSKVIDETYGDFRFDENKLMIQLNTVHLKYREYMIKQHEMKILSKTDLINYLKYDPSYLDIKEENGELKRVKMHGRVVRVMIFDYTILKKYIGIKSNDIDDMTSEEKEKRSIQIENDLFAENKTVDKDIF